MSAQTIPFVTPEEYLDFDRRSDVKNEYIFGEIVSIVGGTPRHGLITANIVTAIGKRLRPPCGVYSSDTRVCIDRKHLYAYPDLSVICPPLELVDERRETVANPKLVVEVLSPTTRDYDLGRKLRAYHRVPSLDEILFVEQESIWVEHWRRMPNRRWEFDVIEDPAATLSLNSLGFDVPVSEFYSGVDFT